MLRFRVFYLRVCAVALCALLCLFTGCASTAPGVEELLRAPVLSRDYSDIQTVLAERYNSTIQLKYPTEGELLSPFSFSDWDSDGEEEAVVLFTTDTITTTLVAILDQDDAGVWNMVGVANGLSDTVCSIEFAAMQAGNSQQIVLTFQAQGEQYLAVYAYQDGWLNNILAQPYQHYVIEDLTGSGTDDLILMSSNEEGVVQMQMLSYGRDGFTQTDVPSFLSEPFVSYANITASKSSSGLHYLVVDGYVGEGQTTIASEMLWYNKEKGLFQETNLLGTQDLYNDSKRYGSSLLSMDIDGDGVVEIPTQVSVADGALSYAQKNAVSLVSWRDFTRRVSENSFGVYDDEYNYYLELPEELKGNVMVMDAEDGQSVEVRNLAGDVLYFGLRVASFEQRDPDWFQIGTVASQQIQVKMGVEIRDFATVYTLSRAIHLL